MNPQSPTHYMHHNYLMEQNGKTMTIWRVLPPRKNDHSATEPGDFVIISKSAGQKHGAMRFFPDTKTNQ